jgi:S-adenosylmethionine hydrolase
VNSITEPQAAAPPIALLTDFGVNDWYVGVMKGVLATRAAGVPLVDLTHGIAAGDVRSAAFVLENSWKWFPPGSVFLVVVDPGVGTSRRPLAVRAEARLFVGPDNGVLSPALSIPSAEARVIDPESLGIESLSPTFHGRDLFAPAAAHLATGHAFDELGVRASELERLEPDHLVVSQERITGHVIYVDRFGNCITDIDDEALKRFQGEHPTSSIVVQSEGTVIRGVVETYGAAPEGKPCALIGSSGRLEIAVPGGDAATRLGLEGGDVVEIRIEG